jgi:hypothetical protein
LLLVLFVLAALGCAWWWGARGKAETVTAVVVADMPQQKEDERELEREASETVAFQEQPENDILVDWTYHFPTMRAVGGYDCTSGPYGSQTEYLLRRTANGDWLMKATRHRRYGFDKVQLRAEEEPWQRAEDNLRPGHVDAHELEWHAVRDEHVGQVENGYQIYLRMHVGQSSTA